MMCASTNDATKCLRIVRGQAKILVVVTFERHLAYLRTMKLA